MTSFVTPRTWNVGEVVTKAMLDEQIRDNINAIWVGAAGGDIDYYASATTKQRLAKPASATSILQMTTAGVPSWLALPLLPFCAVKRAATMTVGSAETSLLWTAEIADVSNWHNNVTNNERITPGVAGNYIATTMVHCSGGSSDALRVRIYVNNTTLIGASRAANVASLDNYVTAISYPVALGATDYINVTADNNGGNTTMQTDSFFSVMRVQ